ncbi:MAG TPA: hypothetical protein VGK64_13010 [Bryobacteraceae bacterium]
MGILRFQKFYRKWAQGIEFDVLRNELYDDYYDQAHFAKEFKRMTGYPPRQFSLEVSTNSGDGFPSKRQGHFGRGL